MTDIEATVAELREAQKRDVRALGDPGNPFGGLFDALSATDIVTFKRLGLIQSHIPAGCYAPLTKLTPRGRRLCRHLEQHNEE